VICGRCDKRADYRVSNGHGDEGRVVYACPEHLAETLLCMPGTPVVGPAEDDQ
jgi:hypothetical protein